MAEKALGSLKRKHTFFLLGAILLCLVAQAVLFRGTTLALSDYVDEVALSYNPPAADCPVKIHVYDDLGYSNEVLNRTDHGFNMGPVVRLKDYTYIDHSMANWQQAWIIIQKFLNYSSCTTERAEDADFFILPFIFLETGERMDAFLEELERRRNSTLSRNGGRDHVMVHWHNTRWGFKSYMKLSNRTKELVTPMVKVLCDIYGYWYGFKGSNREGGVMNYKRLLTVPYASSMREYTGNIHADRPFLASYVAGTNFPEYRKAVMEQCNNATDCFLKFAGRGVIEQRSRYDDYVNSTFFFCPGGDTGPRKALFDGLAVNSIPVIFEEIALDVTYPAFFPGNPRDYSIMLATTADIMGQLRAIPPSRIAELRQNIARVRASLSYVPNAAAKDATWVMMRELRRYKLNGYESIDRFVNKTSLRCVDKTEEQMAQDQCRFGKGP